jgi:uncharacterized protein
VKFTRDDIAANYVRGISDEGFKFGDEWLSGTIAITDDGIVTQWTDKPFNSLEVDDFEDLLGANPEIVIVGTGSSSELTPRALMFGFARRGTGLEVMDSRAAARTYNVLVGEGRRVAAVLYSV